MPHLLSENLLTSREELTLPLENVTVIDFSQVMLGPAATQMLADFGADVIKVERPERGDLSRWSVGTLG